MDETKSLSKLFQKNYILLSDAWLESCINWCKHELPANYTPKDLQLKVYEQWLIFDMREVEVPCLPPNLSDHAKYILNGVYSLQLMCIVDISKPKHYQLQKMKNCNEHVETNYTFTNNNKRVLQLKLSDGVQEIEAIEASPIPSLNLDLRPGIKVQIIGPVTIRRARLLLMEKNIKILGGEIEDLAVSNSAVNVLSEMLHLKDDSIVEDSAVDKASSIKNIEDILCSHDEEELKLIQKEFENEAFMEEFENESMETNCWESENQVFACQPKVKINENVFGKSLERHQDEKEVIYELKPIGKLINLQEYWMDEDDFSDDDLEEAQLLQLEEFQMQNGVSDKVSQISDKPLRKIKAQTDISSHQNVPNEAFNLSELLDLELDVEAELKNKPRIKINKSSRMEEASLQNEALNGPNLNPPVKKQLSNNLMNEFAQEDLNVTQLLDLEEEIEDELDKKKIKFENNNHKIEGGFKKSYNNCNGTKDLALRLPDEQSEDQWKVVQVLNKPREFTFNNEVQRTHSLEAKNPDLDISVLVELESEIQNELQSTNLAKPKPQLPNNFNKMPHAINKAVQVDLKAELFNQNDLNFDKKMQDEFTFKKPYNNWKPETNGEVVNGFNKPKEFKFKNEAQGTNVIAETKDLDRPKLENLSKYRTSNAFERAKPPVNTQVNNNFNTFKVNDPQPSPSKINAPEKTFAKKEEFKFKVPYAKPKLEVQHQPSPINQQNFPKSKNSDIKSIDEVLKLLLNRAIATIKVKAKFKSLVEKLSIKKNCFHLLVKIEDESGELVAALHGEIISDTVALDPVGLIYLVEQGTEIARSKIIKALEDIKTKVYQLNGLMEIELNHTGVPVINKLL